MNSAHSFTEGMDIPTSKIKFDGKNYLAYASYNGNWYPFWNHAEIPEDMRKSMTRDKEYQISREIGFTNCGHGFMLGSSMAPCSGLWPNPNCNHCGGYGVGASFLTGEL